MKEMIKVLRWCILLACCFAKPTAAIAQPDSSILSLGYPVYSQYLQNGLMINPAYAGTKGYLSALVSYRMQWMNMPGSPRVQSVSLHTPLRNDKAALGIMAQFMKFGYTKSASIYGDYAYHIRLRKSKISFGLKAGFDRSSTDYTDILSTLSNPDDPVFLDGGKPLLLPNAGAGVYFFNEKMFAGVAVPSFLTYRKTGSGSVQPFHSFSNYDLVISAGALVTFSPAIKFKPSVLIDYSLNEAKRLTQLDINGNFILADLLWLGGSWRSTEDVAVGIVQLQVNPQLMIGISYDYNAGRMKIYKTGGSTEFVMRYEFGYKVSASNPRYF